ncbi:MAG: hypothetical protein AMJ53_08225 [Gammaproteobacteria bacterium SG8_11]|nr:MAG: hypothetical protein AMJ53_08225 [Gammaproteobacteria bacterium SG8_11]
MVLAATLVFTQNSHAVVITIDDSIAQSQYINESSSYSGTFNLSASLDSQLFTSPYDISWARLDISLTDDSSDGGFSAYYRDEDSSGWSPWYYYSSTYFKKWYRLYKNYSEVRYANESEQAGISISSDGDMQNIISTATNTQYSRNFIRGDQNSYGSGYGYAETLDYHGERTGLCNSGYDNGNPIYVTCTKTSYTHEQRIRDFEVEFYYDYSLDRTISYFLQSNVLDSFIATGVMDFSIEADLGDFFVTDVSLVLNIEETPSVSVPEPTSFALLGLGLVGLGIVRKKKRSK